MSVSYDPSALAPGQHWLDRDGDVWTVTDDLNMWTSKPENAVNPGHIFATCYPLKLLQEVDAPELDMVNHPPHYQTESGLEAIEVIEAFFSENYLLGTTFKYLARAGKKDDVVQDLEKARWYLDREIARRKAAQ